MYLNGKFGEKWEQLMSIKRNINHKVRNLKHKFFGKQENNQKLFLAEVQISIGVVRR